MATIKITIKKIWILFKKEGPFLKIMIFYFRYFDHF